jgi:Bacterial Ig-like domain (group 3)
MSVVAVGSLIAATTAPAAAAHARPSALPKFATVTVSPSKNLVTGQTITVKASKFPKDTTTLYAAECASQITSLDQTACDLTPADIQVVTPTNGAATFKFTVHTTGNGFAPVNTKSKCEFGFTCYIVVTNGATLATTTYVGFPLPAITFKDLRPLTHTKVTSKKTITAGKSLTIKAATTHAKGVGKPTGTVIFKANGKKIGKATETASGKVSLKHTFKKAGKEHITATYSGNKNYQPSTGKKTVTVKKKK